MTQGSRRASALVSAGILLSRVSGLVRERAVGHFLGLTSPAANAFAYAMRIPNILQNLLGEGVLSASFIPVHVALLDDGREDEARRLAGTVLGLLAAVAGGVAVLLVLGAGPLASLLVPGKPDAFQAQVATLLRIVSPGLALLVVSAWCLGILNSHRQFFLSYVAPVVWNLAQIVAVVVVGMVVLEDGVTPGSLDAGTLDTLARALAWGTLAGGVLQVAVQVPRVRALTPGLRPRLSPIDQHTRRVLRAFVPVVTGRGVVQLATFVDLVLASLLAGAALATLQKVQILALLPVSLFGMSVAAAELPELSGADQRDRHRLLHRLDDGLERIAFYVLPTVIGFLLLGDMLVCSLFCSGNFVAADAQLVWVVLIGATLGLVATTSSRLLQSVLYGGGDARGPARIAIVRVVLAAAVGVLLMIQLDRVVLSGGSIGVPPELSLPAYGPLPEAVRDASQLRHLGALGLSLASGLAALVEYRLLRELVSLRLGRRVRAGGPARGRLIAAAAVAGAVALVLRPWLTGLPTVVGAVLGVALVGSAYVGAALALGVAEAAALLGSVRSLASARGGSDVVDPAPHDEVVGDPDAAEPPLDEDPDTTPDA